jgi:hypothetical protein
MNAVVQGYRDKISALKQGIVENLDPVEMRVEHYFAHGTYTRELHIPANTAVVGKIHRHSCINIMTKGKMLVMTEDGHIEISAPYVAVSDAGVQKGAIALEDTVWLNVHPWAGEPDLEQIEHYVIAPSYESLEAKPCLGG